MPISPPLRSRTFDELAIGDTASLNHAVAERDIALFAVVSGDENPCHLDAEFAATDPFGHVVAHGMWSAALVSAVLGTELPGPGTIYLSQDLRFCKPVVPGDEITATVRVSAKHADRRTVELDTTCVNQHGDIVLGGRATVLAPRDAVSWPRMSPPEIALQRHGRYASLMRDARGFPTMPTAVVHPCSVEALRGALEARDEGLLEPILVGPETRIRALAEQAGLSLAGVAIEATPHSHAAAEPRRLPARASRLGGARAAGRGPKRSRRRGAMSGPLLMAVNAGSSSIKLGLFELTGGSAVAVGHGLLDLQRLPLALALRTRGGEGAWTLAAPVTESLHEVVDAMLDVLAAHGELGELAAVGHRVVHGGTRFHSAVRLDGAVIDEIDALTPLAPLHQPHSVRLIRALRRLRPTLAQTASFDTAFHARQDDLVRRFALPRALHDEGILRYGFHGLSYTWIAGELARRAPALATGRVVAAHLGSGASLCAMRDGRSVDSSMGFSTLDGVPMGTRCGALDAGVVLHLIQQCGMQPAQVEDLLYHRSGLLGVSGLSPDARTLEASDAPAAREALELFALRCAGEIARLAASLGGLDAIVFSAGIGEHDAALRAAICARLGWLGLALEEGANAMNAERISAAESAVAAFVIPTNEEQVIADEALALLGRTP